MSDIRQLYYLQRHKDLAALMASRYDYEEVVFKDVRDAVFRDAKDKTTISGQAVVSYLDAIREKANFKSTQLYFFLEMTDDADFRKLKEAFPGLHTKGFSLFGVLETAQLDVLFEIAQEAFLLRDYNNEVPWCVFELTQPSVDGVDDFVGLKLNYFDFVARNLDSIRNWLTCNSIYSEIFRKKYGSS